LGKGLTFLTLLLLLAWLVSLTFIDNALGLSMNVTLFLVTVFIWGQIYLRLSEVLVFHATEKGSPMSTYGMLRNLLLISFVIDLVMAGRFFMVGNIKGKPWAETWDLMIQMAFPGTMGVSTLILALVCGAASSQYRYKG